MNRLGEFLFAVGLIIAVLASAGIGLLLWLVAMEMS